ncbi:uncharacterized protein [Spinacia oleracea]|nr:uncharacterized protein LOC110795023 isoform X2 [Spinacia oleracea]
MEKLKQITHQFRQQMTQHMQQIRQYIQQIRQQTRRLDGISTNQTTNLYDKQIKCRSTDFTKLLTSQKLTKKMRENRSIPHRMRVRSDNTIRYNAKRMHWCRTKLREISEEEGRIWWWEELINGGSTIRDKYGEEED